MNISIKTFDVLVREEYLYDNDPAKVGNYVKGKVVGVSTYLDAPITFHVVIDNEYMYSDLPITALIHKVNGKHYTLETLSNIKCPKYEINAYTLDHYDNKTIAVYFKNTKQWVSGIYMMSFDFYTDNQLLHLVKMNDGNFCLAPNHKINWNNQTRLSDYKKNHTNHTF